MAFVWIENIGKGTADITKAAIEEIRDNLDQIKDNEACTSDKTSDYSTNNIVDETAHDIGYDATDKVGVDTGYDVTYNLGYLAGVDGANYGTNYWGDKTGEYAGQNSVVYSGNAS